MTKITATISTFLRRVSQRGPPQRRKRARPRFRNPRTSARSPSKHSPPLLKSGTPASSCYPSPIPHHRRIFRHSRRYHASYPITAPCTHGGTFPFSSSRLSPSSSSVAASFARRAFRPTSNKPPCANRSPPTVSLMRPGHHTLMPRLPSPPSGLRTHPERTSPVHTPRTHPSTCLARRKNSSGTHSGPLS